MAVWARIEYGRNYKEGAFARVIVQLQGKSLSLERPWCWKNGAVVACPQSSATYAIVLNDPLERRVSVQAFGPRADAFRDEVVKGIVSVHDSEDVLPVSYPCVCLGCLASLGQGLDDLADWHPVSAIDDVRSRKFRCRRHPSHECSGEEMLRRNESVVDIQDSARCDVILSSLDIDIAVSYYLEKVPNRTIGPIIGLIGVSKGIIPKLVSWTAL